jgi:hypothetical protein
VAAAIPALAALAEGIGDPLVRNRGTLGGSIANADPAADYPAAVLGLGATVITDRREIAADTFFTGLFDTALAPGEIVTSVRFPIPRCAAYCKFPQPASRFALVGVRSTAPHPGSWNDCDPAPCRRHRPRYRLPTPREIVDAFIHAPVLVPIGDRFATSAPPAKSHAFAPTKATRLSRRPGAVEPARSGTYRSVAASRDPSDNPVAKRSRPRRIAGEVGHLSVIERRRIIPVEGGAGSRLRTALFALEASRCCRPRPQSSRRKSPDSDGSLPVTGRWAPEERSVSSGLPILVPSRRFGV